jgi:ribonuclease P protein component
VKRKFRLTRSTDFQRVRRLGKSFAHPLVVLIVLPNEKGILRCGIAASKAIGNAVKRNRAKRQIRAVLHPFLDVIQPGWDMIILARRPIVGATTPQIYEAIAGLLRRSRLLQEVNVN